MKVTLINTADAGGGAAAACKRLLKALRGIGVDVSLLVRDKKNSDDLVQETMPGVFGRLKAQWQFLIERIPFVFFHEASKSVRFAFSTGRTGSDISCNKLVRDADILHLHWINQGFLSVKDLISLTQLGKPIVWTQHDMWAFTGGCHYSGDCDHFTHECGHCWMLRNPRAQDLSHQGWLRKRHLFSDPGNMVFVTCSNWLAGIARKSSLLQDYRIEAIPNPIDTKIFSPGDKNILRQQWNISADKKIILFGAANINDRRKGIIYLVEALELLKNDYGAELEIVVFGKNKSFNLDTLPFKVHALEQHFTEASIAELYSLANVYVTTAIEDNLPNTVMEALACGTPVVAFNTGGIPDMVDHLQNGYLAEYKSPLDVAAGIRFVLENADYGKLSDAARQKVLENFTNGIVAAKYQALYQSLLN